ncbi:MAG TPA: hypothetical protein VEA37_07180 [Flavobacterium sp.]|nr:hypothetical protein [Flavobacterium sp.]
MKNEIDEKIEGGIKWKYPKSSRGSSYEELGEIPLASFGATQKVAVASSYFRAPIK